MQTKQQILAYLTEYGFYFICGAFGGAAKCIFSAQPGKSIVRNLMEILASGFLGFGAAMLTYSANLHINLRGAAAFVAGTYGKSGLSILAKQSNKQAKTYVQQPETMAKFMNANNNPQQPDVLSNLLLTGKITPGDYTTLVEKYRTDKK